MRWLSATTGSVSKPRRTLNLRILLNQKETPFWCHYEHSEDLLLDKREIASQRTLAMTLKKASVTYFLATTEKRSKVDQHILVRGIQGDFIQKTKTMCDPSFFDFISLHSALWFSLTGILE